MAEKKDHVPNDLVFVTKMGDKLSEIVEVQLRLFASRNQIYDYQGRVDFTIGGYKYINRWAKISIIKPTEIKVGDKMVGNPYYHYEGGKLKHVTSRAYGVGYTINGLVILDQTVQADFQYKLLSEISSTIKKYPEVGFYARDASDIPEEYKVIYYEGDEDKRSKERTYSTAGKAWKYIHIDDILGGVQFDFRSKYMPSIITGHIQRVAQASTRVETMLLKQILKNHPAIGIGGFETIEKVKGACPDIIGTVRFYVNREVKDEKVLRDIVEKLRNGEIIDTSIMSKVQYIQSSIKSEEIDDQDIEVETAMEANDTSVNSASERDLLIIEVEANIDKLADMLTKNVEEYSTDELRELLKNIK